MSIRTSNMSFTECPRDCDECSVPEGQTALVCDVCTTQYWRQIDVLCTGKHLTLYNTR